MLANLLTASAEGGEKTSLNGEGDHAATQPVGTVVGDTPLRDFSEGGGGRLHPRRPAAAFGLPEPPGTKFRVFATAKPALRLKKRVTCVRFLFLLDRMPSLVRDLIDEDVIVFISCQACGRLVRLAGPTLLGRLGRTQRVRHVLSRLTCEKCGMLGEMTLKFERVDIASARLHRGLNLHNEWPSWPSDLEDIDAAARGDIEAVCNLYSNITAAVAMRQLFNVQATRDRLGNAEPRAAIFPKGLAPVVRIDDDGQRELLEMRWGFLTPAFSKRTGKPIKPQAWNNARDDKLIKSGLWSSSFRERRCLIPASSFNETKGRQPATDYWFGMLAERAEDRPPFAIAGLWRMEQKEMRNDGENGLTHTMVTTEANDLVRPIHAKGRMPVILDPDDYETWLTGTFDEALTLLKPWPADAMRIAREGIGERADPGPQTPAL
ncbi:MAG: SOS response-associated peptidase [Pseudomonadota bacterium]